MAHGFRFRTGPSSADVVEITSSDLHTGVLLDSFRVDYSSGSVETRSYPSFPGNTLYVIMVGVAPASGTYVTPAQTFSVNNATKTVTISNGTGLNLWEQGSAFFTVLGF